MNFSDTYETPLRSYVQSRIETLENSLEEAVRNRSNVEMSQLEQRIDRETEDFLADVTKRLHQVRDEIKSHRPTNNTSPDYEVHVTQYRQLLQSSSAGVDQMKSSIETIFDKILSIVKNLIQWIKDNAETIRTIIKQIRDAFILIKAFF